MRVVIIFIVLLCFGCKKPGVKTSVPLVNELYSQARYYSEPVQPGEEVCDTSFAVFINKFENDTVFQLRHTELPLFYTYSDEDFPMDTLEKYLDKGEYDYPVFSKDSFTYSGKKYANELYIERAKDSVHYLQVGKNSYVNLTYHFAYKNGCWYLVRFDDMTD